MAVSKDFQALRESDVSVKYVQGGEKREGFLTELVDTPFSVAETLVSLPSALLAIKSPVQVTAVREGSVTVRQPRRPAEVGNCLGGSSAATAAGEVAIHRPKTTPIPVSRAVRRDWAALPELGVDDLCCDDGLFQAWAVRGRLVQHIPLIRRSICFIVNEFC
jgi:hypothetical protein